VLSKTQNGVCWAAPLEETQNKNFKILFVKENVFVYMESFDSFYLTNDEKIMENLVFQAIKTSSLKNNL